MRVAAVTEASRSRRKSSRGNSGDAFTSAIGFDRVLLMLDGDEAGRLGVATIAPMLASRMSASTIILEEGKQPDHLAPGEIQHLL